MVANMRDDLLRIDGGTLDGASFADRTLLKFTPVGATFIRCGFERLVVQSMTLGSGAAVSVYEDCVFDGAKLRFGPSGFARLIRCSFRDVDILTLECDSVDFIDCSFSGRLRGGSIDGTVPDWKRDVVGREQNIILGNDFSGVRMIDFHFQSGVDLTRQKLPRSPDYLYLPDGAMAAAAAREILADCPEPLREGAELGIAEVESLVGEGQRQIWLRKKELFPGYREAIDWLLDYWDRNGHATPPP